MVPVTSAQIMAAEEETEGIFKISNMEIGMVSEGMASESVPLGHQLYSPFFIFGVQCPELHTEGKGGGMGCFFPDERALSRREPSCNGFTSEGTQMTCTPPKC